MKQTFISLLILLMVFIENASGEMNMYLEQNLSIDTRAVSCLQTSPDGRFLSIGTHEGKVLLWDVQANRKLHELAGHNKRVTDISFDSKNRYLITGAQDGRVCVWDLYSGNRISESRHFGKSISQVTLSPDDRTLAVGGERREIYLYEFPGGQPKGSMKNGHRKGIVFLDFNLNGDEVVSIGYDNKMIFWNPLNLRIVRQGEIQPSTMGDSGIELKTALCSADRQIIGIGYQETRLGRKGMNFKYNLVFYEWKTGSEIEILEGNKSQINSFSITPDKKYIITDNSSLRKKRISIWNLNSGIIEQNKDVDGDVSILNSARNGQWLTVAWQKSKKSSIVSLYKVSGVTGFERFNYGTQVQTQQASSFGSAIKITTPTQPIIQFGEKRKLAVIHFDHLGVPEDISKTATYLLESKLGNSPQVDLIERNQIDNVLNELNYQMSGLTTDDAISIGKQLNAKYILLGSLNKLGSLLILTTKIVNVETAAIEGTREVQCSNASIEDIATMVTALAPTIVKF